MTTLRTPCKRVFDYPEEFVTLPDYTAHRGQVVTVLRRTSKAEADRGLDLEKMYDIQADDGWKGHAFESEIQRRTP